jgi:phosphoribosylformylglycinamidine cyclo-ligase
MVHITSGGFCNLNRVQSDGVRFVIDTLQPTPPVFDLIQKKGNVSDSEMHEVFNMGTGFCVIVESAQDAEDVIAICKKYSLQSQVVGQVEGAHAKGVSLPGKNLFGTGQKFQSS